jgi:DNA-binding IclR family transcriptional regulator
VLALASATRFRIAEIARPFLLELSRECGETVDLSQLDGSKLVFLDQIGGAHQLRAESGIGVSFALHSTAPGKAMLALMTDEELARIRPRLQLVRRTRHTIVTWPGLLRELVAVRQHGIAADREENTDGICAQAIAVRLPTGGLAAISVPVPTQRFAEQQERVATLLRNAGARLRQILGRERSA